MRLLTIVALLIPASSLALARVVPVPATAQVELSPAGVKIDRIALNQYNPRKKRVDSTKDVRKRSEPSVIVCPTDSQRETGQCICKPGTFGKPGQCRSCDSVARLSGSAPGTCGGCKRDTFENSNKECQSCDSVARVRGSTPGTCGNCQDNYRDDGYGTCKQCVDYNRVSGRGGRCGACLDTYGEDEDGACKPCRTLNRVDSSRGFCSRCLDGFKDDGRGACKPCSAYGLRDGILGFCGFPL